MKLTIIVLLVMGGFVVWRFVSAPLSSAPKNSVLDIRANDHVIGQASAPVTVVEYTDFQCPACGAYYPVLGQLLKDLSDKMKLVVRYYPLIQVHPNALVSARAAEAAGRQGKYTEMYDELFVNQKEWSTAADPAKSIFPSYAGKIGIDVEKFKSDIADSSIDDPINVDRASGDQLSIQGTPTFFINGEQIKNPASFEAFKSLIEDAAKNAPQVAAATTIDKIHEHADVKVMINGKAVDFSLAKYQTSEEQGGKELDPVVHLHDGNGTMIHLHQNGITLGRFLQSLGMSFSKDCFVLDTGEKFCNSNGKTLKLFVNGERNDQADEYGLHDLDRILVSYGNENTTAVAAQVVSVGDSSCIYSEKCPERGKPPTEGCIGGLGTNCTK